MPCEKPNILWLSLESTRADHTPLYGYHRDTTPHLRALSERDDTTVLSNGIAASNWTAASTASMLTGTHLSTHQVGRDRTDFPKLADHVTTLPKLLQQQGYRTALFANIPYISDETGLDRGFEHTDTYHIRKANFLGLDSMARDHWRCGVQRFLERPTLAPKTWLSEIYKSDNCLLQQRIKRWLTEEYSSRDPFFIYGHVPSPHITYNPIEKFANDFVADIDISLEEARAISQEIYESERSLTRIADGIDFTERQLNAIKALYDGEIKYADYTVDNIINAAREASDSSLVIVVTGDHGDLFGECGVITHQLLLHDGLIRVPMLVSGIEGIVDGSEIQSQHIDLTYTLAAYCDAPTEKLEGRDLRDEDRTYAISQTNSRSLELYLEHNPQFDTSLFFEEPFTSVRTARWKYLESDSKELLFELPDEETVVRSGHAEVVEELSAVIERESIDWTRNADDEIVEFDSVDTERLKNLGYMV